MMFKRLAILLFLLLVTGIAAGYYFERVAWLAGSDSHSSENVPQEPAGLTIPDNWLDIPVTPGDWAWSQDEGASVSRFGEGLVAITCDASTSQVIVLVDDAQGEGADVTIVTETETRALRGERRDGSLTVTLDAEDDLLDAMAFSRGRFGIFRVGREPIMLRSWPEISRVIEDCRNMSF